MDKFNRVISIAMLVLTVYTLITYFVTGKYLALPIVCLISFIGFTLFTKKK